MSEHRVGCEDVAIDLTEAALGGEAAPRVLRPLLDRHLVACRGCEEELAALRAVASRVRRAGPRPVGEASPVETLGAGPSLRARLVLVAATILGALALVGAPLLLAERGPRVPTARTTSVVEELEPASATDPRLLEPEAPALIARASVSELTLVATKLWHTASADVAPVDSTDLGSDLAGQDLAGLDATDVLIARLDGPAVERALERLGQ